jgi:hypothetical protein
MRTPGILLLLPIAVSHGMAAEPPQVQIASSSVRAAIYLPNAEDGYYRATRFDWSGVIANLEWNGHSYFGKWFDGYDPKIHDAIMGPVEEFLTGGAGLGYAEAKVGEGFVKIGAGVLRKPEEPAFRQFSTYEFLDHGKWTVNHGADWIEFTQQLAGPNGYAYVYSKTLRLAKDKPVLEIAHSLKNTGRKAIETSVYEHDFYMLDGQPTGPDFTVKLPFPLKAVSDLKNLAEIRGKQLAYLAALQPGQTVMTELLGYSPKSSDYDIRVENGKTGAGVRQTADRPISKLVLWSIKTTVCPEAYIHLRVEPGRKSTWRIAYEFYTAPRAVK